jgi:rubredoxin
VSRFAAKPVDLDRPPIWHKLADRLIAQGWLYDASLGEWVLGEPHPILGGVGWEDTERGRIAWEPDGSRAWLTHPGPAPTVDDMRNRRVVSPPDSHHTDRDTEYHTATEGYCPACGADRSEIEVCEPSPNVTAQHGQPFVTEYADDSLFSIEIVVAAPSLEDADIYANSAVDFLQAGEPDGWTCRVESIHTYEPAKD